MVNENPLNRNQNNMAIELQKQFFGDKFSPILGDAVLVRTVDENTVNRLYGTTERIETHGFTQRDKDFLYFQFTL
jgi:hypothetical protein